MERIDYSKNLRDVLGFSLAEIKDMVELRGRSQPESGRSCTMPRTQTNGARG